MKTPPKTSHAHTRSLASLPCIAFEGSRRIMTGELGEVALKVKQVLARGERAPVLIFDNATSELVEVDFRGRAEQVLARLELRPRHGADPLPADSETETETDSATPRGPGRPKLGVQAREVTLLPRHWEWLGHQPGGSSVALRRLVEEARRTQGARDRKRHAQEVAYRFMHAMAGDRPGFEEAARALFSEDADRFKEHITAWPLDVRNHALMLASEIWGA